MDRPDTVCDACDYNAPCKAYPNPSAGYRDGKYSKFCAICASTASSNAKIYGPDQYPSGAMLFTICYAANTILDSLGLLWPTEETAATMPSTGPNSMEIERDALSMRVFDLEDEITSLNKQADEAIDQRDKALDGLHEAKRDHEIEISRAMDRIAVAEAHAAVLNVSEPEDTTEEEEEIEHAAP